MNRVPVTIIRFAGFGRYVWEPALQIVDFFPPGHRRSTRTLFLTEQGNTLAGALRAVGNDVSRFRWSAEERR